MPEYTVRQGDSLASIAYEHHFHWETIWDHPGNEALRQRRDNPNVLFPGDVVFIPDRERKEVPGATEQLHRFRRRGVPERLRIRLVDELGDARADQPYVIEIDGRQHEGQTDADGRLEEAIPPNARSGRLLVGEMRDEEYELTLGHLDPGDEISGVQARLNNLGFRFFSNEADGEIGPGTIAALRAFQRKHGLPVTGEIDEETLRQLQTLHGA